MKLIVPNKGLGHHIVSLALDTYTKDDLTRDGLDVLYVSEDTIKFFPGDILLSSDAEKITALLSCNNYDVFELQPNDILSQIYDVRSVDNSFFVTPKCNSNCIMCPSPDASRRQPDCADRNKLIEIAKHIPASARHLTITGGEPFMIGPQLFDFLEFLQGKFFHTECLILTNGRVFAVERYAKLLRQSMPKNTLVAIPVHGSTAEQHDLITRAEGSFTQTIMGIKRLLKLGVKVELRIVVTKLNADDLINIAALIATELPKVEHVCIMAAEMTGNARQNIDQVWISYKDAFKKTAPAIKLLIRNGITVKLYNFPLCVVGKEYTMLCEKSISPEKVRYAECCDDCALRDACGGVFAGTYLLERNELRPIS